MTKRYSRRTAWDLEESSYAVAVRRLRESGRPHVDLTLSNPTRCGFAYPKRWLRVLDDPAALSYDPDPRGIRSAREAVSRYYADHAAPVAPESLFLTTSTSEGYSFLLRLLCDPGDEVLIAQPSYPLFDFLAMLDDVNLVPYPLFYDHGWFVDFAELERRITPRTRAIIVVHPNNPTGHFTSNMEREQLEQVCIRNGLSLIVDEVFLDYSLNAADPVSSFASGPHAVPTFCLSGISKIAGLPQMKAAWIAVCGPEPERTEGLERLEVIADTFLSMNAPVQAALPLWLAERRLMQQQILERIRENEAVLRRLVRDNPEQLRVFRLQAGWSAVLSLPACGGMTDCAERLAVEHAVIVHPGSFYRMSESNRIVISLLPRPEDFRTALARIV